ncbi:MAG: glycerol-3-phosphate acyltransferase, partial [Ruminococcus sp.]|nr:glycerol-3-phosphate acyltransferase [Ruminococcus sp.]
MNYLLAIIIASALGYLLGSLNFSIIFVKILTGKDIREMGSKNAGLTNTYRCAGKQ